MHRLVFSTVAVSVLMLALLSFSACGQNVVYQRPVAELNQKAQNYLNMGDTARAVARLESARDLVPDEPTTLYNLAIAYKMNRQFDAAAEAFESLKSLESSDAFAMERSIGITFEEKGDFLLMEAGNAQLQPNCQDSNAPSAEQLRTQAKDAYENAVVAYRKTLALPQASAAQANAKEPEQIKAQADALMEKLEKWDEAPDSV